MSHRTKQQYEANQLDLETYRLIERLRDFASGLHREQHLAINEAATRLSAVRGLIRSHMHAEDRRETA